MDAWPDPGLSGFVDSSESVLSCPGQKIGQFTLVVEGLFKGYSDIFKANKANIED